MNFWGIAFFIIFLIRVCNHFFWKWRRRKIVAAKESMVVVTEKNSNVKPITNFRGRDVRKFSYSDGDERGSRGTWRQKSRESRWNLDGLKDRYFLGRCRQQRKLQWRQGQQLQSRIERSPLSTFAQPWVVYYVFLRITRLQSYYYCCGVFHNGRELSFAHAA